MRFGRFLRGGRVPAVALILFCAWAGQVYAAATAEPLPIVMAFKPGTSERTAARLFAKYQLSAVSYQPLVVISGSRWDTKTVVRKLNQEPSVLFAEIDERVPPQEP